MDMGMKQIKINGFETTCNICGKTFRSLYRLQIESNFKDHMRRHEEKKEVL